MQTTEIVTWAIRQVGIEGVSTMALVVLVAVGLYVHKLSSVGGLAVSVGSTAAHDAKVATLTLLALLLLGVISAHPGRAQELIRLGLSRWVPKLVDAAAPFV